MEINYVCEKLSVKTIFKKKIKRKNKSLYLHFLIHFLHYLKCQLLLKNNRLIKSFSKFEINFITKKEYKIIVNTLIFLPYLVSRKKKNKNTFKKIKIVQFFINFFINFYFQKKNFVLLRFLTISSKNFFKKISFRLKIIFFFYKYSFFCLNDVEKNLSFYHTILLFRKFQRQIQFRLLILIYGKLLRKFFSFSSIKTVKKKKIFINLLLQKKTNLSISKKNTKNILKKKGIYYYYLKNRKKINKLDIFDSFFVLSLINFKDKNNKHKNSFSIFFLFEFFVSSKTFLPKISLNFFQLATHFYSKKEKNFLFKSNLFKKKKDIKIFFHFTNIKDQGESFSIFFLYEILLAFFHITFVFAFKANFSVNFTKLILFNRVYSVEAGRWLKIFKLFCYFSFSTKFHVESTIVCYELLFFCIFFKKKIFEKKRFFGINKKFLKKENSSF
jgi:hypothetical protein